jgi:hypothetical protein
MYPSLIQHTDNDLIFVDSEGVKALPHGLRQLVGRDATLSSFARQDGRVPADGGAGEDGVGERVLEARGRVEAVGGAVGAQDVLVF